MQIRTLIGFGGNTANRNRATYFRHSFEINNPATLGVLSLAIRIDDGAVVYVNGTEVLRRNMPNGTINFNTLANASVGTIDSSASAIIPRHLLVAGTNVVAVQVHQVAANSSDKRFDLQLRASASPAHTNFTLQDGSTLILSAPDGSEVERINIPARTGVNNSYGKLPNGTGSWGHMPNPTFGQANQGPALAQRAEISINEIVALSTNVLFDEDGEPSPWVELYNLTGATQNLANYTLSKNIDGSEGWALNSENLASKSYSLLWLSGKNRLGSSGSQLVPANAVWKYLDDGSDQGMDWVNPDFNDANWAAGPAELGYGDSDEATVINGGPSGTHFACSYFRHEFQIADKDALGQLRVQLIRDDGAIVYLNGVEVVRDNMPAGPVNHQTWATSPEVAGEAERTWYSHLISKEALRNGRNVLAVRVHQQRAASSDVSFNLRLEDLGKQNHAPFTVVPGEILYLLDNSMQVVSSLAIPTDLPENVAIGLAPDGHGSTKYFLSPTPRGTNGTSGLDHLPRPTSLVLNPYHNVKWATVNHFKSNIHTHTTNSDGSVHAHAVIDAYHNAGYKILSITDHNLITWPWTNLSSINSNFQNRDPAALGMLAVEGNELSGAHHAGSYINVVTGSGSDLNQAFSTMTQLNGIGSFKHPGRYWSKSTNYTPGAQYSIEWYQDFYNRFPVLVDMEVYNQGDRYPDDRILWDELLSRMMPDRPIWGQSSDDMHTTSHYFKNYGWMLMDSLTMDEFRRTKIQGASFFVFEPNGDGTPRAPVIDSITVNRNSRTITLHAQNFTSVQWISGIEGTGTARNNRVIQTGTTFNYTTFMGNYVRAVVINSFGRNYTQPFGFANRVPVAPAMIAGPNSACMGDTIEFSVTDHESVESYEWSVPAGGIILAGQGTPAVRVFLGTGGPQNITVVGKNRDGSTAPVQKSVQINGKIVPTFSFPTSYCAGQTANALPGTSDNGIPGVWNSQLITDSSRNYLFTPAPQACARPTDVLVRVNPVPATPSIAWNLRTLASDAPVGNQWHNLQGAIANANAKTFNPILGEEYFVIVTLNGCSSAPSNTMVAEHSVKSNTNFKLTGIRVHMNHENSLLIIETNDTWKNRKFQLVGAQGRIIANGKFSGNNSIYLANQTPGVYWLQVDHGAAWQQSILIKP